MLNNENKISLNNFINDFINKLIRLNLIKLFLTILIIIWAASLTFIFMDSVFKLNPRFIHYYRGAAIAAAFIYGCLYYYLRIYQKPSVTEAARHIEKIDPCCNYLSTAVEIGAEEIEKYGFSAPLYECTLNAAAQHYLNKDSRRYIDYSIVKKLAYVITILFIASLAASFQPGALKRLNKIWPSAAGLFMPAPLEITSLNGDFTSYVDEDIDFAFQFSRAEPVELYIQYSAEKHKNPFYQIEFDDNEKSNDTRVYKLQPAASPDGKYHIYNLKMPAPSYNFYYRARSLASDSFGRNYFVASKRRPEITKMTAAYEFPRYTRIAPMIEENATSISALFMSSVKITANSNAPLKSAGMIFSDNRRLDMEISGDGKAASVKFNIVKKDSYKIELTDTEDTKSRPGRYYDINVYEDKYPYCEIIEPAGLVNAPYEKKIDITVKAGDDFAVSKLVMNYYKTEGEQESFEVSLQENNASEIFSRTVLDFSSMNFKPGDSLYYYAAAFDNDDISGPKSTKSAVNKIVFPTQFDEALELEALYGSIETRLNKISDDQKAIAEKIEKIDALSKQGAMNEYELKKNYENIARGQQNLMNEAKELTSDLKEALKKMENNIYIKPETLAKISEIQQKLEEMINDDMKRLMSDINKNIEKTKLSGDDVKKLSEKFDEKKLVEKFERLKELFSKAEKEQKLTTFIKELESLVSKQEFIAENTEKAAPETGELNAELAREQKNIGENFEKALSNFEKNIGAISEISEEIQKASTDALDNLKKDEAGKLLKEAGDSLSQNMPDGAFDRQRKALGSMKSNLDMLKNAFDKFKQDNKKELLEAVSALIRRTIAMSEFEMEIIAEFNAVRGLMKPAAADKFVETLDDISEKCIEIANTSREIAGELTRLSKKTILIDSSHIAVAGSILRQFAAIRPMLAKREYNDSLNLSNQIYYNISILNLMLIDIFDILNSSKSGSNMDQLMAMIKKQAEAQSKLNAKTKDMMKKMGENGMPELSDDALKSLAFEQQMIRRSLERIMDSAEGDGEMARKLRELRSEMQNLEVEYLRKKVDSKVQSRQKVLHERLLDMQQALFKEKETTERKAERAKNYAPAKPAGSIEAQKYEKRELKLDDAVKNEKYPRSYEKIIELYFEAVKKM